MPKNPYLNAFGAVAYIAGLVSLMGLFVDNKAVEGTVFMPMMMLSLFVLSAAVMGFLFVYTPAALYLDGKKHEALELFLKTVGTFAALTLIFVVILLSSIAG